VSREDLCGKTFAPIKRSRGDHVEYAIVPVRCGSWECPTCRRVKSEQYRKRIGKLFDGRPLWFVTLTYYHDQSPDDAWRTYNKAWNRLRTNLSKQFGKFSFVRVLESHKTSPYPHLHCIIDRGIPPTKFGPACKAAGCGYQIEIKPVTSSLARAYITKYLSKEWTNAESLAIIRRRHCRRISFSRDVFERKNSGSGWIALGQPCSHGNAVEMVETDIDFTTTGRLIPDKIIERDDFCWMSFLYEPLPDGFYRRDENEGWCPDDWVPR
jgi:hypothetical protein